ncbi:MAG: hypothetical protein DMG30_25450 [Acidobacteria bacterium]|nr:MAG: hypothetical protein DMG30_25450 [Acidobacteriota bacterium]
MAKILSDIETANLILHWGRRTCSVGRGLPWELNLHELRRAFVAMMKATEPGQRGHTTASGRANSSSRCFLLPSQMSAVFVKVANPDLDLKISHYSLAKMTRP